MSKDIHNIVQLRQLLADKFPHLRTCAAAHVEDAASAAWRTGLIPMDQLLGGGLPKAAITELVVPHHASGSALIILALLRQARRQRQWLALVDGQDSFDPAPLDDESLSRLLWVRCRHATEAMKAADLLSRDNNLPLLVLDLRINPAAQLRRLPPTNWYRLQRNLERNDGALMVLTPFALVGSARTRLALEGGFGLDDLLRDEQALLAGQRFELLRAHGGEAAREFIAEAG